VCLSSVIQVLLHLPTIWSKSGGSRLAILCLISFDLVFATGVPYSFSAAAIFLLGGPLLRELYQSKALAFVGIDIVTTISFLLVELFILSIVIYLAQELGASKLNLEIFGCGFSEEQLEFSGRGTLFYVFV